MKTKKYRYRNVTTKFSHSDSTTPDLPGGVIGAYIGLSPRQRDPVSDSGILVKFFGQRCPNVDAG